MERPKGLKLLFHIFVSISLIEFFYMLTIESFATSLLVSMLRYAVLIPCVGAYFNYKAGLWIAVSTGCFFAFVYWLWCFSGSVDLLGRIVIGLWAVFYTAGVCYLVHIRNHAFYNAGT